MFKYLRPSLSLPQRINISSLDLTHIALDSGRSIAAFNRPPLFKQTQSQSRPLPPPEYIVSNTLPPAPADPHNRLHPNSSLCPPLHIHTHEDEIFHIISGTATFLTLGSLPSEPQAKHPTTPHTDSSGLTHHLTVQGATITIPAGTIHTFRNASCTDPLKVEFGFRPAQKLKDTGPTSAMTTRTVETTAKMTNFLLNVWLYRDACAKQGVPRFLPQVLLFNHEGGVLPVPTWVVVTYSRIAGLRGLVRVVAPFVGRVMNVVGGLFVGRYLLGLSRMWIVHKDAEQR